jgi:hypothetical protein
LLIRSAPTCSARLLTRPAALVILLAGGLAAACGSSSVTNVTAPDGSRCAASVTADPVTVVPDGGTVTVAIAAERECTWSARSDASWLLLRQTSGQGEATVSATVARNEQPVSRSAALTVNDQRLTITQQPRPCDLSLQGFAGTVPFAGGTGTVRVTTIAGCAWTATSSAPWLLVQTPTGSGTADVRFNALANDGPAREAGITIAGQTTVITQAAVVVAPVCTYAINSQSQAFPVSGGTGSVTVSTPSDCEWTATGGTSWVRLLTTSGNGPGQAQYQVDPNPTTQARQATLTIAGRVHTVTQSGLTCTYAVSPPNASFSASGGTGSLQVNTLGGCTWNASSNAGWIVVGTPSGNGTGQVSYQVLPNTFANGRSGTITVGGQTHTVTQAAPCTYAIDPPSATYTAAGGQGTLSLATGAGCTWTATSSVPWITVGNPSGTGPADVGYAVAANTGTTLRSGTVTIAGQTHAVTQAAPCTYAIVPPSATSTAASGQGTVSLTTGAGCTWTATSSAPWITVGSPSGTGSASVGYAVAANTPTTPRSGTVTIGGQTHTVTQAGALPTCTYTINPTSATYAAGGGQGTEALTTGPTCALTATSSATWITVGSPTGSVSAGVGFAVADNTTTTPRSGTVTIGGQAHTVTQAGALPTCTYTINPTSAAYAAGGGQGTVALTTGPTCAWTATSSATWITVGSPSGTGSAGVGYAVAANTTTTPRSGTVTIGGQTHTVTQAGAIVCTYSVSPGSVTVAASASQGSVTLTTQASCAWTATSNVTWLTLVPGPASGAGTTTVGYSIAANTATTQRVGTLTIGGQTHTVTQAGAIVCAYAITPEERTFGSSGGPGTIELTTEPSCTWNAIASAGWVTVLNPDGTGSAEIAYSVSASGGTRLATVTVGGQSHRITQTSMAGP